MYFSASKKLLLFSAISSIVIVALSTDISSVIAEEEKAKIVGTVHMITEKIDLPKNLEVQLIVLEETKQPSSITSSVDKNGNFEFMVNTSERYNYIPLLIHNGIRYLSKPQSIQFSGMPENKQIRFDIYQSTSNTSSIIIEQTKITLMKLQRSNTTLTFLREDSVRQNEQYVYIGNEIGYTIQIPLFENTLDASAEGEYFSEFKIEGNYLTTQMPIRPGLNKVITKHIVSYDKDQDHYLLSIINSFPSNVVLVEIPEGFVNKIKLENNDSWEKNTTEINNASLLIFSKDMYIKEGQSTNLTFVGLSGLNNPHIFASISNSILAIFISLILISVIGTVIYRKSS